MPLRTLATRGYKREGPKRSLGGTEREARRNMLDGTPEGYAQTICLDHTSFLPTPMFQPQRLEEDGRFSLFRNEVELFTFDHPSLNMIEDALVEATKLLYIRTGDLIAVELSDRKPLTNRTDSVTHITGTFGQDKVLDFQIIF